MVKELVALAFKTRDVSHLAHWGEDSGFRHETLGDFYDELVGLVDKFVECYQGNNGKQFEKDEQITEKLIADAHWIEQNREALTGGVRSLDALLDDISNLYLQNIYKLQNLK
jgi:hypothetical protein